VDKKLLFSFDDTITYALPANIRRRGLEETNLFYIGTRLCPTGKNKYGRLEPDQSWNAAPEHEQSHWSLHRGSLMKVKVDVFSDGTFKARTI
jgi:hypothetical protein